MNRSRAPLPLLLAYLVVFTSLTGKHIWGISHMLICEGDKPLVLLEWKQNKQLADCVDFDLGWNGQDEIESSLGTLQPVPFEHLTQICKTVEGRGRFLPALTYLLLFLAFTSCCHYFVMDFMIEKLESQIVSELKISYLICSVVLIHFIFFFTLWFRFPHLQIAPLQWTARFLLN